MLCRIKRKIKKSDERNQVKKKMLICSSLLTAAKRFATIKECFATANLKLRNTSLGFAVAKRFATTKPLNAEAKEGSNKRQPSVRHGEGRRVGLTNFDF